MSIHCLSVGMEMGDNVTLGPWQHFGAVFSVTVRSTCSVGMVSDDLVTYLSIPFTIDTKETVWPRNKDSTSISIPK